MSHYERDPQAPVGRVSVTGGGNVGRASVVGARRYTAPEEPKARRKKRMSMRRRRVYAALIMAAIMFLGAGTVVGAAFFQSVPLPDELAFGESTSFTYSNGKTAVAGYGEHTRKLVDSYKDLPDTVVWSLLALEDKNYFEHEGVDYKGTMRAIVNNITGGDTQGASTISQQYAGMVAEIRDDMSYGRKAREAIMAMKLEQKYSKEDILLHYLNLNFYGRGSYGIAAASEVWFGKPIGKLTWGEAMVLVMQVKAGDGSFDPRLVDDDDTAPLDRWTHGMKALKGMGHVTQEDIDAGMPKTKKQLENPGSWGHDTPTGFITNPTDGYVWAELESRYGLTRDDFYGKKEGTGGYTVVLTIDKAIQAEAESTASRGDLKRQKKDGEFVDSEGNVVEDAAAAAEYRNDDGYFEFKNNNESAALYEYNESMASSVVAVEPGTGAVLGYYGGANGLGVDKAGLENPHPPSSTFKMITAATAILNGASVDSWWNSDSPRSFETLEGIGDGEIDNAAGEENLDLTLTEAVRQSRNTPMYAIAEKYGATAILQTAVAMGVRTLQDTTTGDIYRFYEESDGTISYSRHNTVKKEDGGYVTYANGNVDPLASVDGTNEDGSPVRTPVDPDLRNEPFYYHIAFGQFPTTVMDMANAYATIAADGVYNEAHFVEAVYDRDGNPVEPIRKLESDQAIDASIAKNLQEVGSEIHGASEPLDRDYTGKTGTWEAGPDYPKGANAHTWYVGAIPQLSIAAWVGNATAESAPLLNSWGTTTDVFGSTLSEPVWNQFMRGAIEAKGYEEKQWSYAPHIGSPIIEDIINEDGTIDRDSGYCAANPHDTKCGRQDNGNGNDDEDCDPISEWLGQCQNGNGRGNND